MKALSLKQPWAELIKIGVQSVYEPKAIPITGQLGIFDLDISESELIIWQIQK